MVCKEWEEEDTLLTNIEVSKRAIDLSMDGMVECLAFTVESQEGKIMNSRPVRQGLWYQVRRGLWYQVRQGLWYKVRQDLWYQVQQGRWYQV